MFCRSLLLRSGFWLWLWACMVQAATAQMQYGGYTYTDNGSSLTITKCSTSASGAVEIPASIAGKPVTRIGVQAFAFCSGMSSLVVPEGMVEIGDGAFLNCTGLTAISLPSTLRSLGASALYSCSSLVSLEIPAGITSLSASLLGNCYSLTRIVMPPGITSIGASAFSGCTALAQVEIPAGVTIIDSNAFFSCSKLARVTLPAGLRTIAFKAFADCLSLDSIVLPASLVSLGDNAFTGCALLRTVHLPASLGTLGVEVFRSCTSLVSISVDSENQAFCSVDGVLFTKARLSLLAFPAGLGGAYVVPEGTTMVVQSAFRNSGVSAVTLPASLTTIGGYAFASCKNLTSVRIPAAVNSISGSAFRYNSAMTCAIFAGDAPATFGTSVFSSAAAGFTVRYYQAADGFSSPTWKGYTASAITNTDPASDWLTGIGLPAVVDLSADDNGDGVNLLLAYALNLNPTENLAGRTPQPVLAGNQLSLNFYAGAAGVSYRVETSSNLRDWTTEEVTISAPDANQVRTASVPFTGGARYLRLLVSYDQAPAS